MSRAFAFYRGRGSPILSSATSHSVVPAAPESCGPCPAHRASLSVDGRGRSVHCRHERGPTRLAERARLHIPLSCRLTTVRSRRLRTPSWADRCRTDRRSRRPVALCRPRLAGHAIDCSLLSALAPAPADSSFAALSGLSAPPVTPSGRVLPCRRAGHSRHPMTAKVPLRSVPVGEKHLWGIFRTL